MVKAVRNKFLLSFIRFSPLSVIGYNPPTTTVFDLICPVTVPPKIFILSDFNHYMIFFHPPYICQKLSIYSANKQALSVMPFPNLFNKRKS